MRTISEKVLFEEKIAGYNDSTYLKYRQVIKSLKEKGLARSLDSTSAKVRSYFISPGVVFSFEENGLRWSLPEKVKVTLLGYEADIVEAEDFIKRELEETERSQ